MGNYWSTSIYDNHPEDEGPEKEIFPNQRFPSDPDEISALVSELLGDLYNEEDAQTEPFIPPEPEPKPEADNGLLDLSTIPNDLVEIEFDIDAINTTPFFMGLKRRRADIEDIPKGIHNVDNDLKVIKYKHLCQLCYTATIEDLDLRSFSASIKETVDPFNHERVLLEVQFLETHIPYLPERPNRTNVYYLREDGIIRISGNPNTPETYLVNRARQAQNIAVVLIKKTLSATVPHSIDSKPAPL